MAERYVRHALTPDERREFEEHLVDCQECGDRILLAEMFLGRNGGVKGSSPAPTVTEKPAMEPKPQEPEPLLFQHLVRQPLPLRKRIAAQFSPWLVAYLFLLIVLILLAPPAVAIFTQERILHR